MRASGGSRSFNVVNQRRVPGRWMRMLTIPNQSSVAKVFLAFDEAGRMKPSAYFDRVVDVMVLIGTPIFMASCVPEFYLSA
jgi:arsenic resistance protein ArsH